MKKRKSLENTRFQSMEICVSQVELQRIKDNVANSTCHNLSQYVRQCSLGDPVTVYHRNKSFDEFVNEIISLRRELQEMRKFFSKEKEEQAIVLITQIKESINKLADHVRQNWNK